MKAVRIHEHGSIEKLKIDSIAVPEVQPDEVLIKVQAAALNHLDLWVRIGVPGVPLPLIMGSDAAGVIEKIGEHAHQDYDWRPGDEVIQAPIRFCGICDYCTSGRENLCKEFYIPGESIQGMQAEFVVVPAKYVFKKPTNLNWQEAAALPLAAMTAYHMLVAKANVKPWDHVLVYGASSGVGSAGIQIAKAKGARVITTVGSPEKAELAKQLGADHIIDYTNQAIGQTVKEITSGKGVDIVLEHPGLKTWNDSLRSLKRGGTLVTCGATTGAVVKIDLRALFIKHQRLIGSTMGTLQDLKDILQLVEEGKYKPVVDKAFPVQEIQQAHRHLQDGAQFGKVVLDF